MATAQTTFQYREAQSENCSCPIHAGRSHDPFTAPLGHPFADRVSVREIPCETAAGIYEAHHSYIDSVPEINLVHYGLQYRGNLVGAITFRYPLLGAKAMYYDECGRLLPEPIDIENDLPRRLWETARTVLEEVDESDVARREVVNGGKFVHASRICIGVAMPNLASAALARAQERFVREYAAAEDVRFLRTLVRADYDAAMVRALKDKGWTCTGYTEPSQASNRKDRAIRERFKWRFCCPVATIGQQTTLDGAGWEP